MTTGQENVGAKFVAAWKVFASTCAGFTAPEATFQAWFAHYLISQFGIDRVAREVDFGHKHPDSSWKPHFGGNSVNVDAVVTRRPGIWLPRRSQLEDRSGISRLGDLAVISELKVASTTKSGLDHTEVCRDHWKLAMLMDEAERRDIELPLAYVCVLDNNPAHTYSFDWLESRLAKDPAGEHVRLLRWSMPR